MKFFKILFFIYFCTLSVLANDQLTLLNIVKETLEYYFKSSPKPFYAQFAKKFAVPIEYKKRTGLFVTLSLNGQTRACWGSINPQHEDLVKATIYTTIDALTKEYRYPPINSAEIQNLRAQVTIIKALEPLKNISSLNPLKDGLLLRAGAKSAVILPGETMDAHYALVQARLKARIKPVGEAYQMYKIKVNVYR